MHGFLTPGTDHHTLIGTRCARLPVSWRD